MDKVCIVSIIIPVYNVKTYLNECVESCIMQSYDNIEILLVDDGSTDGSGKLCDELSLSNKRIKCIHKENGGLSDARNCGIEHSLGDYIMFVDSDDVISDSIVEELLGLIIENQADVSVCGIAHFVDGNKPNFVNSSQVETMLNEDTLIDFLYQKKISTSSCAKLYRRDLLKEIRFIKGQRFEDNPFLFKVFNESSKVVFSNSLKYGYRHRNSSITTSPFTYSDYDIIDIGRTILKSSNAGSDRLKKAARAYQCTNCLRIYLTVESNYESDERFAYAKEYLEKNACNVIGDGKVRSKVRIALLMFLMHIPRKIMHKIRAKRSRWE